ncbi:hypothetical protein DSECCO2_501850 [anaerobic digester metagenome]
MFPIHTNIPVFWSGSVISGISGISVYGIPEGSIFGISVGVTPIQSSVSIPGTINPSSSVFGFPASSGIIGITTSRS